MRLAAVAKELKRRGLAEAKVFLAVGLPLTRFRRAVLVEELDGLIFLNPDRYNENNPDIGWETADEYLSGNVRDKLRVAKAMAADTGNPQAEKFAGNVAALEKVQPEWIEASDIDVKIGTTWIEPLDYEQFIYELLNTPKAVDADLSGPEEEREADDRMESAAIVAEDKGAYPADREGRTR